MKLHVFDFDGTLVDTPADTPENRSKYEKAYGMPWIIDKELAVELTKKLNRRIGPRKGWYGRAETLEPPLVPDPAPQDLFISKICQQYQNSREDSDAITVIMTGRHAGLKRQVLRILDDGGLVKCQRKTDQNGKPWIEVIDPNVQVLCLGENGPAGNDCAKPGETLPWKLWIIKQFVQMYQLSRVEIWEDREAHVKAFWDFFIPVPKIVHDVSEILRG